MCSVNFSIELRTFQLNDKDLSTNNICEKSVPIFKMYDVSVCRQPIYVSFWDDSLVSHPPDKVLVCPFFFFSCFGF